MYKYIVYLDSHIFHIDYYQRYCLLVIQRETENKLQILLAALKLKTMKKKTIGTYSDYNIGSI